MLFTHINIYVRPHYRTTAITFTSNHKWSIIGGVKWEASADHLWLHMRIECDKNVCTRMLGVIKAFHRIKVPSYL